MTLVAWNPQVIFSKLAAANKQAVAMCAAEARKTAPHSSGALARSILPGYTTYGGNIHTYLKYAASQEYGSRSHSIAAVRKQALYHAKPGFGPVAGPVEHPGTGAKGFMHAAAYRYREFVLVAGRRLFLV